MQIKEAPIEAVWQMRQTIMYPSFALEQVKLPGDSEGLHLGLYEAGELVSVISVFTETGSMQFRKFATQKGYQGKGYGTRLLQHVLELAVRNGCTAIWCNARTSALPFYEKFGLQAVGETWMQHGHMFIKMEKQLTECR